MLTVEHAGHSFRADGNTVFVGKEHFVFIGDVEKMESREGFLYVTTNYDDYVIVGTEPDLMYANIA